MAAPCSQDLQKAEAVCRARMTNCPLWPGKGGPSGINPRCNGRQGLGPPGDKARVRVEWCHILNGTASRLRKGEEMPKATLARKLLRTSSVWGTKAEMTGQNRPHKVDIPKSGLGREAQARLI